jgi:hypothetical protein
VRIRTQYIIAILFCAVSFYSCMSGKRSGNRDSDLISAKNRSPVNKNTLRVKEKGLAFPIVDSLKTLFSIADTTRHPFDDTTDNILNLNQSIAETLKAILTNPQITSQNMDSLLKSPGLGIVHSEDKRLWIFSWYENNGGSFKSNANMVYYKTGSGKSKIGYDESDTFGQSGDNLFSSNGASFDTIYKLNSKTKDLYLCTGSGVGCNTCVFQVATVVELKKDSADFNYPAFKSNPENSAYPSNTEKWQSDFLLGAREDDILTFYFDPKNQILNFSYLTDDNTPVQSTLGKKQSKIFRKLKFNGENFIGDPYQ